MGENPSYSAVAMDGKDGGLRHQDFGRSGNSFTESENLCGTKITCG
jgi:hypothetical protein